ncbi:unnamed protein product, partial [Iphiclides podalirius]
MFSLYHRLLQLVIGLNLIIAIKCARPRGLNYFWVEDDPSFDCVTPIAYWSEPYNVGVFIGKNLVATSENPLESNFKRPDYLQIYVPDGRHYISKEYDVAHNLGDIWGKSYFWVYWGSRRYADNPVHDIMFMHININVSRFFSASGRRPYYLPVADEDDIEEPSGWKTAAFALVDKSHVNSSTRLIPVYYDEPVLVDCEEWFPRFWGYFICIMNLDNYPVIQSGAPLIQNNRVFGIASFSMRKGKESIYAFTDLRPYSKIIAGVFRMIS